MRPVNNYFTVIGFADLDGGVETFTEIVYGPAEDAYAIGVDRAMRHDPSREFLRQATEISTFIGICTENNASAPDLMPQGFDSMALDPSDDDLESMPDLTVFRRSYPSETPGGAPDIRFHWWDEEQEAESRAFTTYGEALSDRNEDICG